MGGQASYYEECKAIGAFLLPRVVYLRGADKYRKLSYRPL